MYNISQIFQYYQREGLRSSLLRALFTIESCLYALIYVPFDIIRNDVKSNVCIIPRNGQIDQDTISVITSVPGGDDQAARITVGVKSIKEFERRNKDIVDELDTTRFDLQELNTIRFVTVLSTCKIVLIKDSHSIWIYRILSRGSKRFIRIHHGVPTKGHKKEKTTRCTLQNALHETLSTTQVERSVASDIEAYYRSSINFHNLSNYKMFGYPRFDRILDLKDNPRDAILNDVANQKFQTTSDFTRILYAPTHKDGMFKTNLFPFQDFNPESLISFLEKHQISIFIRMHPAEEDILQNLDMFDNNVIFSGGSEFSTSSTEILPFFDGLITDYSSIYHEYVLLDRPIIFLEDNIEEYKRIRNFAFDYDVFWPGPKVSTFDDFLSCLDDYFVKHSEGTNIKREIVKESLHSYSDGTFLNRVMDEDSQ